VNFRPKLVNIDGIIAKVDPLPFIDAHDEAVLADIFDGFGFWDVDFDAGLEDGSGNHENDEQHENHVHERDHVDLGERSLRRFGELHHIPALANADGWGRPRKS
jgi:hypothetical protein